MKVYIVAGTTKMVSIPRAFIDKEKALEIYRSKSRSLPWYAEVELELPPNTQIKVDRGE